MYKNQWLYRASIYTENTNANLLNANVKPQQSLKPHPINTKSSRIFTTKNVRRQIRPPLRCFSSDCGGQALRRTQVHATSRLLYLSDLQAKPALFSHFQVTGGAELLRGNDAAVSHSNCFGFADFHALRLSPKLRLDP